MEAFEFSDAGEPITFTAPNADAWQVAQQRAFLDAAIEQRDRAWRPVVYGMLVFSVVTGVLGFVLGRVL
jgi:hypothetical protein